MIFQKRGKFIHFRILRGIGGTGQYRAEMVGTWWYLISVVQYLLEFGGTGSVILTQYRAVLVGTWWYWVSIGRY